MVVCRSRVGTIRARWSGDQIDDNEWEGVGRALRTQKGSRDAIGGRTGTHRHAGILADRRCGEVLNCASDEEVGRITLHEELCMRIGDDIGRHIPRRIGAGPVVIPDRAFLGGGEIRAALEDAAEHRRSSYIARRIPGCCRDDRHHRVAIKDGSRIRRGDSELLQRERRRERVAAVDYLETERRVCIRHDGHPPFGRCRPSASTANMVRLVNGT